MKRISFSGFLFSLILTSQAYGQTDEELILNAQHAFDAYNRAQETLDILGRVSSSGQSDYLYISLMGRAHDELGHDDIAMQYFERCLQINPNDADILARKKIIDNRAALERDQQERVARQRQEEEDRRRRAQEAEEQRKRDEEARRVREEQDRIRKQQEEEARRKQEEIRRQEEFERRLRDLSFSVTLQAGLGVDNIPMIVNNKTLQQTKSGVSLHPVFHLASDIGILDNKGVSLHIKPMFSYGDNFLDADVTDSHHATVGVIGSLYLAQHYDSPVRVFGELGFLKRNGEWTSKATDIASATTIEKNATYNYGVVRFGGGIMIDFYHYLRTRSYIKPGVFLEQLSYFPDGTKPVAVLSMQGMIMSDVFLELLYSRNYAISGTADYPSTIKKDNQDFFGARVLVVFNLIR